MDVDSVPFGVDFIDHVNEQLSACAVMIVVMGRSWLNATDKRGRRRLDLTDDYVRNEILEALKRKVPVIPVRVQSATMPDAEDLPDDLRGFARRNAIELSHSRWHYDMQQLLETIRRFLPQGE
jgi:hypothetical protein